MALLRRFHKSTMADCGHLKFLRRLRGNRRTVNSRFHVPLAIASALVCCVAAPIAAAAEDRAALVIGNSAYLHTSKLENPGNDATDVANALRSLSFKVIEAHDLDKAGMDRAIREFAEALSGAKVGLFYYAGHGIQVGGQNYLVPTDAALSTASALDFEMVRLDLIHRTMESASSTNIIFLDACRDNPLSRNLARALGTRSTSVGRGLAAVESGEGTLISFSTQPGSVALDGDGRNSPFAAALVKHVSATGDDLSSVLINVRNDVMEATSRRQVPWEHSAMTARFYFVPPSAAGAARDLESIAAVPPAAQTPTSQTYEQQAELAFWNAVKDSGNPLIIKTYLDRFPNGTFAGLAKAMTDKLAEEEVQKSAAKREAELARAEAARKAAEAISDATRNRDVAKQSEVMLKSKDEAMKAADRDLAAAEKAAQDAREAALRAKAERDAAAAGGSSPRETGSTAVASMAAGPSPASLPSGGGDPTTLTVRLQSHLKRVGCDPGDIDGNWGTKARAALRSFAENAKLALPVDAPTEAAFTAVASKQERVCSLSCDDDEVLSDGECVRKSKSRSRSAGNSNSDDDEPRSKRRTASSDSGSERRTSNSSRSRSVSSGNSSSTARTRRGGSQYSSSDAAVGALILGAAIGLSIGKGSRSGRSRSSSNGTSGR
jgi:Caspase domain